MAELRRNCHITFRYLEIQMIWIDFYFRICLCNPRYRSVKVSKYISLHQSTLKGHHVSLSVVSAQLKHWADSAALKASRANDPDTIHGMQDVADQYRKLMAAVAGAAEELRAVREALAEARKPKAATVRRRGGINAFEFWRQHGQAVNAIIGVYGLEWKTRAPFGDTILATTPAGWRSGKTEKGGVVCWSKDHRMPAARFWPDQKLPDALTISPDYERACLWAGYGPPEAAFMAHTADWHRAHGYVWYGGEWVFEIQARNSQNYSDAIEAYKVARVEADRLAKLESAAYSYGPQPLEPDETDEEPQLLAAE